MTGAGGSIGSELCRQIAAQAPAHLVLLDISEFATYSLLQELEKTHPSLAITPLVGSVQDQPYIAKVLGKFAIDTIYHAAAYKHVPLMEQNVMQCIANNVFGTRNTAAAAVAAQVNHLSLSPLTRRLIQRVLWARRNGLPNWCAKTLPANKALQNLQLSGLAMY